MQLSLIVATGTAGVIGYRGAIPWHLPVDLAYFKKTTMGAPIIMGRRTFESIGRPLPGRRNLVLSRTPEQLPDGVEAFESPVALLESCSDEERAFVIGGSEIYALFLPQATRIYRTDVAGDFEGDTFFPRLDSEQWEPTSSRDCPSDEKNLYSCTFVVLERKMDSR
ncbi:MAG: dihydrofolate reductase [Planctomycetota bacterium]|nr:dihydrofolate reductase [Planctomycetota bacterium]